MDEIRRDDGIYVLRMYIGDTFKVDLLPEDAEPIPVSVELIDIFGLHNYTPWAPDIYSHGKYIFRIRLREGRFWLLSEMGGVMSVPFDGLHDLQNIYKDITGKDLEVKFTPCPS